MMTFVFGFFKRYNKSHTYHSRACCIKLRSAGFLELACSHMLHHYKTPKATQIKVSNKAKGESNLSDPDLAIAFVFAVAVVWETGRRIQ
jgi:hypothetical protein